MAFVPPLMATACWPNQSIMPQSKGLSVGPGSRRSLRSSSVVQYKEQLKTRQTVMVHNKPPEGPSPEESLCGAATGWCIAQLPPLVPKLSLIQEYLMLADPTLCSFILILISEREDVNLPQPFLQSGEFLLRSGEGRV